MLLRVKVRKHRQRRRRIPPRRLGRCSKSLPRRQSFYSRKLGLQLSMAAPEGGNEEEERERIFNEEDVESNIVHMHNLQRLSKPPFQQGQRNDEEEAAEASQADASQGAAEATINASKEAESSHKD